MVLHLNVGASATLSWFNSKEPNKLSLINRIEPMVWLARSADFNPLDFYDWEHAQKAFPTPFSTVYNLVFRKKQPNSSSSHTFITNQP